MRTFTKEASDERRPRRAESPGRREGCSAPVSADRGDPASA